MNVKIKSWLAPAAMLLVVFCTLPVFAVDATGKWTGRDKDAESKPINLAFVFRQDGSKFTGTLTLMDDNGQVLENVSINNGKVDGISYLLCQV
jgi:hypothetical protein